MWTTEQDGTPMLVATFPRPGIKRRQAILDADRRPVPLSIITNADRDGNPKQPAAHSPKSFTAI